MGHRRRGAGERLRTAEANREVGNLERVEEGECLLFTALEVEREGRSGAGAVALEDIRLARSLLEETEVSDLLDLRVALQEIAHLGRILAGTVHAHFERLKAAQEHPRGIGVADRADRIAEAPDLVDQALLTAHCAGDEVTVAAD